MRNSPLQPRSLHSLCPAQVSFLCEHACLPVAPSIGRVWRNQRFFGAGRRSRCATTKPIRFATNFDEEGPLRRRAVRGLDTIRADF